MRGSTLPIRATPSESAFHYQPFASPSTEIRLVILHPSATEEDEVKCDLQTLDISEAYDYDALSYAWGDASTTGSIILSGHPFTVTANLSHALRSLRYQTNDPSQTRSLWIDAICINQTDDEERSEQVQRMCSIYKSASGVLVWLGRYHEDEDGDVQFNDDIWGFEDLENGSESTTRKAFELAEELSKYKEEDDDPLDSSSGEDSDSDSVSNYKPKRPTLNAETWGYLSILIRRNWFERLWVVQEVRMAKKATIFCGRCSTKWKTLEEMSNNLSRHRKSTNPGIVGKLPFLARLALSASGIRRIALGYVDRENLLSVLLGTRSLKATDPRDRLYASMGLLEDGNEDKDIEVDYSKDVELIYKEWALKRIRRTRTLDVLSACVNDHQKSESLPSWAPDLRVLQPLNKHLFEMVNHIPFVLGDPHEHMWYSAAGKTRTEGRTVDERDDVLELEGIHVGTIVKIISFTGRISQFNNKELAAQLPKAMDELESQLEEHFGTKIVPGTKVYRGLVDTLLRGNRGSFSQDPFMSRYGVWRGHTPPPEDFEVLLSEEDRRKTYASNLELTIGVMMRKSDLFVTENGDIGCVARHCLAQAGHEIFVLLGGNAPFVLEAGDDDVYELRGSVYMHDYMDGQAISKLRTAELDVKRIKLG